MSQTLNFMLVVGGFILSIILIGKFVLPSLVQKFPMLDYVMKAMLFIGMVTIVIGHR